MEENNIETQVVHGGEQRFKYGNSITNPIFQASTYVFKDTDELCSYMEGTLAREEYGRYGNPTLDVVESKLAHLDQGEEALLFSSGMNAICTTLFALLDNGSHMIITNNSYRRTRQFIMEILSKFGIEYSLVDPNHEAIEKAIRPNTRLIISESPTNPYLRVLDLVKFVAVAKKHNVISMIDSTLSSPYNQRPLDYGVDLVTHSATKYLGGHNDLLAGVIVGNKSPIMDEIRLYRGILGGILDANTSYLLIRGLKTFALRLKQQNKNGLILAKHLEAHPKIVRVYYPGLESHPDYSTAKEQLRGFGGLVSFEIDGDLKKTSQFIDQVKIPSIAPSLGGVESLIEQVCLVSYYDQTTEQRRELGIKENLVRYAVGIEDVRDLIDDIDQALKKI
ncbi:MAG: cystathionine gamma-synthase [bacterium]|nr:MAG: cystathionine gamma-synthase [bacterium]